MRLRGYFYGKVICSDFLNRVSSRCFSLQYNRSLKGVEVINLPPRRAHEGPQGEQKNSSTLGPRRTGRFTPRKDQPPGG